MVVYYLADNKIDILGVERSCGIMYILTIQSFIEHAYRKGI